MNITKGYIYIRTHESYDIYCACKLGKTSNILDRDNVYSTGELKRGNFAAIYELPSEKMGIIEKILQNEFRKYNIYFDSGTEFYNKVIINLIDKYFQKINLEYRKLSKIEIENLERTTRINEIKKKIKKSLIEKILEIARKKEKILPRNYQIDIIDKSIKHFHENEKGLLVLMCGMGKTLISLWITQRLNANKILIGVPNKLLLNQWRDVILKIFIDYVIFTVSSGVNEEDIENFIKQNNKLIIITTFSSSHKILSISQEMNVIFCMKILDESHHLTTKNMILEKKEKKYVEILKIKSIKQISLTATLKQINAEENDDKIVSNDNKDYFGEIIDRKCLFWAIEKSIICDYIIQTIIVDTELIGEEIVDFSIENEEEKKLLISAFSAYKSIKDGNSHHLLVYTNNQENSDKIIEYLGRIIENNPIDGIFYSYYHSKINIKEQLRIVDEFTKSKFGIISCVYCLGEGWDFPLLDGVVFAENMSSNIRIVQSALRASRKNINEPDKIAKIIIPVLYKDDWLESNDNDMKKIREIIYQMGLEDHTIIEKIKVKKVINFRDNTNRESKDNNKYGEYDEELTRILRLKTIQRGEFKISYEKAKKIIAEKNIVRMKDYLDLCEKDVRLPLNPEIYFKDKFENWIEYLNIERKYYDLNNCRKKIKEYLSEQPQILQNHLNKSSIAKIMCEIDNNFPNYDIWKYYYDLEIEQIIQLSVKKQKNIPIF